MYVCSLAPPCEIRKPACQTFVRHLFTRKRVQIIIWSTHSNEIVFLGPFVKKIRAKNIPNSMFAKPFECNNSPISVI